MLNIFKNKFLKEYNISKKKALNFVDLQTNLNRQMKKKLQQSKFYKELSYPEPIKKAILTEVFQNYQSSYIKKHQDDISALQKDLSKKNLYISQHYPSHFIPSIVSPNSLENIFNYILNKYSPDFSLNHLINIEYPFTDFKGTTVYINYLIKKLLISYLIYEFNEIPLKISYDDLNFDSYIASLPKKQFENRLVNMPTLPFCKQHISKEFRLVYDKDKIFGTLSKDILHCFFTSPANLNPYNYTYSASAKNLTDKVSSYQYDKYLDFIKNFTPLIKTLEKNSYNFLKILQYDLVELMTNANFIILNSQISPLHKAINIFRTTNEQKLIDKIRNYCCKFYYHTTNIPMPEYRLILSCLFMKKFQYDHPLKDFTINYNSSYNINIERDTTMNLFNAYIEYLSETIIPDMLAETHICVEKVYQLINEKGEKNTSEITKLNNELMMLWDDIIKNLKLPQSIFAHDVFSEKDYKIYCPQKTERLFSVLDNQIIPSFANKIYDTDNLNIYNNIDNDVFINLHNMIFSAIYHDSEIQIINLQANVPYHESAQINIKRLKDKNFLLTDFDNWIVEHEKEVEKIISKKI